MSRIDYSKWDHIEDSDDDDDDKKAAMPTVTRLEQPSRVTTHSDGTIRVEPQPLRTSTAREVSPAHPQSQTIKQVNQDSNVVVPTPWTERGGEASLDVNGHARLFVWSQDRYSVTYRILLDKDGEAGSKNKKRWTCRVDNILSYDQRIQAVGSLPMTLKVALKEEASWFEGELPHPVHLPENESECDWCIEDHFDKKYMVIQLPKAVPMLGVTLWWKRPFTQSEEIDMTWCQSNQGFQKAWDEAHASFKANVASKAKTTV